MKTCPTCQKTYPNDFSLCPRDGAPLPAQAIETEAQLAAGLSRRFRIIRQLGKGGMGTVFLAEQIGVGNRPVALKVLNRKLLDDPDFLLRFQNEAGSTGRIHHPNVVSIYESAQSDDGTPYIAMEFLEGESLREVIKQRGALPLPVVAEILQQAARGLNAAHKLGIIHRDLKPDNIFLTYPEDDAVAPVSPPANGRADSVAPVSPPASNVPPPPNIHVKIVDFGIAKLRESGMHTQTGSLLGTPAYMSFEQASGMRSDELDARSDVYSLGVVVYEMLTGRTPFHSDTPVGYLRMHMQEDPPPFRTVKPDLAALPQLESVVMKALTKNRNQRYGSPLEFAEEFAAIAQTATHESRVTLLATRAMVPVSLGASSLVSPPTQVGGRRIGSTAQPPGLAALVKPRRVPKYWLLVVITVVIILAAAVWYFGRVQHELPAASSASPMAAEYRRTGDLLMDKGNLDGAIAEYREAIRLSQNDGVAHHSLGIALWRKGDWDGDIAQQREVLRLNPNDADAHSEIGVALGQKGDWDGDIAEQREALRLNPMDVQTHDNLGAGLYNKGDLEAAIVEYRLALRLKPDDEYAHVQLGSALLGKGDLDGATTEYREALHLDPRDDIAHGGLGVALERKGDLSGALQEHLLANRLKPKNPSYRQAYEELSKRRKP